MSRARLNRVVEDPHRHAAEAQRNLISTQVPTEDRVERWSDDDHKAVHKTQVFLAKPLLEVQAFFKPRGDDDDDDAPRHPPKLTSCACEFCWGAAAVVLFARLLRAIREGNPEDIVKAMDALLRALVRINFCYSREQFLLLDVPEDGLKQCTNQIVAALRIMISTPSTRRQLDAVMVGVVSSRSIQPARPRSRRERT